MSLELKNKSDWQPTAQLDHLRHRAHILQKIRYFFAQREVLEVETPLLGASTASDPHIDSFYLHSEQLFLQTSPEFAMKRLLAAGSGPIFQLCKAFRKGDQGGRHQQEFTMLEWYRPGFDYKDLMVEVAELLCNMLTLDGYVSFSYQELFQQYLGIDPFHASVQQLIDLAQKQGINIDPASLGNDKDSWLDLLLSHCIEPQLGLTQAVFIYDYPASQAALSQLSEQQPIVAQRFEAYVQGMELANGYQELLDPQLLEQRVIADNRKRQQLGKTVIPLDEALLAAQQSGLPACAGVALGVDRLIMLACKAKHIKEVVSFAT